MPPSPFIETATVLRGASESPTGWLLLFRLVCWQPIARRDETLVQLRYSLRG